MRQTPSLAAEHVPLERAHSTAPVVKTNRKSCNKALGESTFKSLMNRCHRHGSKSPSSANVKQALPSQCAVLFEALPPSSIMVGPTEASSLSFSLQAPTKALANAMSVEVMVRVYIEEIPTVPVEALSIVDPIAGLTSGPLNSPANVRLRALAPVWPTPSNDPSPIPNGYPLELGPDGLSAPPPPR
jgi:hypothetical protein